MSLEGAVECVYSFQGGNGRHPSFVLLPAVVFRNMVHDPGTFDALIFDCDGTLTDSMPLHYLGWRDTMLRYGIEFGEDRFYSLGGMPSNKIVAMLADEFGVAIDSQAVAHEKEEAFLAYLDQLQPILPIVDIAKNSRGKKPMAVASGGFRDVIQKQLVQIGVLEWFDTLVTAEDTTRHKPEPDVFLEAARRMNTPANRCLVFEDADLGIEAARRAGMAYIDVRAVHMPKRWT